MNPAVRDPKPARSGLIRPFERPVPATPRLRAVGEAATAYLVSLIRLSRCLQTFIEFASNGRVAAITNTTAMQSTPVLPFSRLRFGCLLLASILVVGTVGFMLIEGWDGISAFYTAVLVVSTLGFSDRRPSGLPGELLTIGLIAGGVGTLYYLVGILAQGVIESQLDRGKRRSMDQQIANLSNHFIVCGFGRVGREICRQLTHEKSKFLVIDASEDRLELIQNAGYLYLRGDASDDNVLLRAGIERARGLLTAIQSDAGNVYITLSARALNPKLFIVARAATAEAEHKLRIAGANRVMSPYVLGGRSMAGMALRPAVMDLIDLLVHSDDFEMWLKEVHLDEGSSLVGTTVGETQMRQRAGVTILAVRRADGRIIANPGADLVLQMGDTLIVLGAHIDIAQVAQLQPLSQEKP
jgi:voltage-gated potassium channel